MFHYWSDITPMSHVYSFQLIWLLSEAVNGAADFNEIHRAARNIRAGNAEDWYAEFSKQGDNLKKIGDEAVAAGHQETASTSLFRAFTYYRSAERVLRGSDSRKIPMYHKAVACFRQALDLSPHPHEYVKVPFQGKELDAIYYAPRKVVNAGSKPPCVLFLSGADALPEENFFRSVQQITARGMGCFVFNGPGQGSTLRLHNIPTMAEYERPVGAALDYLITRTDIDHDRIGLLAVSFGGYYGPRATANDPRVKALVAWGALYDVYEDIYAHYPPLREQLNWIAGVKDAEEGARKYKEFTLKGQLHKIKCPVLITHGKGDRMVPLSAAQRTYDELVNVKDKTLRVYDIEEGGSEHCNMDNWSQVIPYQADWMVDRLFGRK